MIRLEDGEVVHEALETFARLEGIEAGAVIILGGADAGSNLVVGPELKHQRPVIPMSHTLSDVHEITGTGTIFPDGEGNPVLHLHMACGRDGETKTGCIRQGITVWQVMEVVLFELLEAGAKRVPDADLGFLVLKP